MDVGKALRNSPKGQLKYDRYWMKEGRTKEVLDNVSGFSTKVSININPKIFTHLINVSQMSVNNNEDEEESPSKQNSKVSAEKSKNSDTYLYELQTKTEIPILEYEEGRLKYIQDIFKAKKEEFENFSKGLDQQTEQQYHLLKINNELDWRKRAGDLKRIEDTIIQEAKEKELLQKQHFQNQAKKLSAIIQEAELKQKKAEEELRKRKQEQQEFSVQLNNCKQEAENLILKTKQKLMSFEYPSYLKIPVDDRINQMTEFLDGINTIMYNTKSQLLTIDEVQNANFLVKKTYESLQDVTNDIELAKVTALQDHEKRILQRRESSTLTTEIVLVDSPCGLKENSPDKSIKIKENIIQTKENAKSKINNEAKAVLSTFIAPDVIEEYHEITENLKTTKTSIEDFVADPRNKKCRFELQKSINVPINAISSVSGSHVRDKISRLLSILSTKAPTNGTTNDSVIYNFCADLIARKFVEQGDKQISAQHSTAFPIAVAIVGVWVKKPEVGALILGHFYLNCPYLAPFYPPHKENQSDRDYYESLGYYFDKEGNMEVNYKFLNRMSGFMRLYSAIILSPVPPSSVKYLHPHGIAHGWKWLSRILNMDPRPDITATLLYDFLDVTGHTLQKTYGKQFKKLLHIICKDYFQKIKRVTPSGSGGPVERLETFLQQTVKKGYIPPPEGILDSNFWNR